ncbi:AfsR/SARP family transcriptional regulator [Streptomyces sp. NPDC090025]|uniref:AfsR/SARP family transcriptional regulator n=1 Tax=Streptomyces sp. NPDC090025 TaxID=3365922 RepID=UPI003839B151
MIFRLLGPFTVDDTPAPGGPRGRALLALLLLDAGRTVPTGRIIDALYGDEPPAGAANALQSQVSRLRRALPPGVGVEHTAAGYRLTGAGPDDVDALRFERLAREGARAGAAGDAVHAERLLRAALALWRGPALGDLADAPYAPGQTARLDALRVDTLEEWAAARLAGGGANVDGVGGADEDGTALVRELTAAAAAHPLRERLRALQIRALAGAGRQAEALAVYEEVRGALAEELGADPSPELAAAQLAVLRGEAYGDGDGYGSPQAGPRAAAPAPAPAPALAVVQPVRPPVPLTGFVGRDDERARLTRLLGAARLVTVVGPGGAGKTRLAVECAGGGWGGGGDAGGDGSTGAGSVFVDLAAAEAGSGSGPATGSVLGAFARALGVRDASMAGLVRALADRPPLLVVDNCEHVVAEAAELVRALLTACPGLRVLATSREALGIAGESLLPLAALAPGAAEELFVRRGAAARPGFDGHARVPEICAALDGLPLALELAAARLRTLTVDEIADRLRERVAPRPGDAGGDRFRLLSRGDRTAPERHRTLAAVVEWSWELLDEEERLLAARFSVFRGGATAEAVGAVAAGRAPEGDAADTGDLLASLVEKSLLTAAADEGAGAGVGAGAVAAGRTRYRMLETVRAYAAARLPYDDPAFAAHTAHFLALARAADPELRGPAQLDRLALLDAEDANLRAALRRAGAADGLRLVAALTAYWWLRGLRGQVAGQVEELLQRAERSGFDPVAAGLAEEYALAVLTAAAGGADHGTGQGDRLDRARDGLVGRAGLAGRAEPLRQPFTAFLWATTVGPEERLPVPGDAWSRALDLVGRGHLALARGAAEEAGAALTDALARFRALGERWGTATALEGLAALSPAPLPLLAEALDLFTSLGVAEDIADLLLRRAAVHDAAGDPERAAADRAGAAETARRAGLPDRTP